MQKKQNTRYTRDELDAESIFTLRNLARDFGHSSPTKLHKNELIDFIIAAQESFTPVENTSKRRGRPPKTITLASPRSTFDEELSPEETQQSEELLRNTPIVVANPDSDTTSSIDSTTFDKVEDNFQKDNTVEEIENGNNVIVESETEDKEVKQPRQEIKTEYPDQRRGYNGKSRNFVPQQKRRQDDEENIDGCEIRKGILEVLPDGYGFLRAENYRNSPKDTYIASQRIRKFGLRAGDLIEAYARPQQDNKPLAVVSVVKINGIPYENIDYRPNFDTLTPIYPDSKFRLEIDGTRNELAVRAIDLLSPIGKGQRGMIVSPPKAGKTTLLKMIAHSIATNYPKAKLMVLLIDERPEEVTDMQRSIKGEVIYSTFDEESDNHIKVAELVLARAKRLVELKEDVVILLDSLTRLARANNVLVPSSGKTLSGGIDPVSLYFPKRFFGAARNIENGGSLTIIATALIDTGSRMDDVVYEEFKGTGNMEIHLDRRLSERRIFPAIDLYRSGTRKEELLLTAKELEGSYAIRRLLSAGDSQEASESVINMMSKTRTNDDLIRQAIAQLASIQKDGYKI